LKVRAHFHEAMMNLVSAKLRSFLAILGVLVGTASVVALVSGGQLATEHALEQFKKLGTDLLALSINDTRNEGQSAEANVIFNLDSVYELMSSIPQLTDYVPYAVDFSSLSYAGENLQGSVVGVTEDLRQLLKLTMAQGRFVSDLDNGERYCVLGEELAAKVQKLTIGSIVGHQIEVGSAFFTIVGVLNKTEINMFFLVDTDNAVIIPINAALNLSKYANINNMILRFKKDANIESLQSLITKRFTDLFPAKKIFFRSPQQIIDGMKSQSKTFTILLGFIGSIALLVGGIGVMNIMLVSVVERRREIGVRMAVGARRRDIQLMFLTESITLTVFGGIIGVILGELIAYTISHFSGWVFHLYLLPPVIGFLVSAAVGMFFGFYPARKASQLDPIECLRSE
jgi:putative ABC transport system permease protein